METVIRRTLPRFRHSLMGASLMLLSLVGMAASAAERLPDTEVTTGAAVAEAWLTEPTRRYAHGVLGDAVEAGGFALRLADGRELGLTLGPEAVFEDRRVRLVDLNGDGVEEMVVVMSTVQAGAALAVFGLDGGRIVRLAESDAIGAPNRWLNPVGVADLDGDGAPEIAWVDRPHILGRLTVATWRDGRLVARDSLDGFSNHVIGSAELDLAGILDVAGDGDPELIVPGRDRSRLFAVAFKGGRLAIRAGAILPGPVVGPVAVLDGAFYARLESGDVVRVTREAFARR